MSEFTDLIATTKKPEITGSGFADLVGLGAEPEPIKETSFMDSVFPGGVAATVAGTAENIPKSFAEVVDVTVGTASEVPGVISRAATTTFAPEGDKLKFKRQKKLNRPDGTTEFIDISDEEFRGLSQDTKLNFTRTVQDTSTGSLQEAIGQGLENSPAALQKSAGGFLQALGNPEGDNFRTDAQQDSVMKNAAAILQDEDSAFTDKAFASSEIIALLPRKLLRAADEKRASFLKNITVSDKNLKGEPEELSLGEALSSFGFDIATEADLKIKENSFDDPTFVQQVGTSAGESFGLFGGVLGASKLVGAVNAGFLSSAFGAVEFGRSFDDNLKETGRPDRAMTHAIMSGFLEKVTELPAFSLLLKEGKGALNRIAGFLAAEIPGENVAELGQRFSELVSTLPEETKVSDIVDMVVNEAPEIMALTTAATIVGGGMTSSLVIPLEKATTTFQVYKVRKQAGEDVEQLLNFLNQSMNDLGTETLKTANNLEEAKGKLKEFADNFTAFSGDEKFGQLLELNTLGQGNVTNTVHERKLGSLNPTVFTNLEAGKVVTVDEGEARRRQTRTLERNLERTKAQRDNLISKGDPLNLLSASEKNIQEAERALTIGKNAEELTNWLYTEGKDYVQELVSKYIPNSKILIYDGVLNTKEGGGALIPSTNALTIEIDTKAYAKILNSGDPTLTPRFNRVIKTALIETLTHEVGHTIALETFNSAPVEAQISLYSAYNEFRNAASKEIEKERKGTERNLTQLSRGLAIATRSNKANSSAQRLGVTAEQNAVSNLQRDSHRNSNDTGRFAGTAFNYLFSFDEWLAHEMEKTIFGDSEIGGIAARHFTRSAALLERFHKKEHARWKPSEQFSTFLKLLDAQVQTENILARGRAVETDNTTEGTENLGYEQAADQIGKVFDEISTEGDLLSSLENPRSGLDKFNGFMKNILTLTQIAKENKHIPALQSYMKDVQNWWATKSKWNERAVDTTNAWINLSKDQADRLGKFALAVTLKSDELGRKLSLDELLELNEQRKHRLSDDAFVLWEQIDGDFQAALGFELGEAPKGLYKVLVNEIRRTHASNPEAAIEAFNKLDLDMTQLANRNFFPLTRFGKYKVLLKAVSPITVEGVQYTNGQTISFETYESKKEQELRVRELRQQYPAASTQFGILDDTQFQFQNLPPNMLQALQTSLGLDAEQQKALDDLILEQTAAARFKKHLLKRAGTPGFSMDAMRSYASYMTSFANHIARMEHAPLMQEAIKELDNSTDIIFKRGEDATKRGELVKFLRNHFDYVMNPGNELANLRSVAFLWYMGFLPKSAAVNLTQIPIVAWPYLTERKELGGKKTATGTKAAVELGAAMRDVGKVWRKGHQFTADENRMFTTLIERGILDESLAQELAGLAEGNVLQRMLPDTVGFGALKSRKAGKILRNASYYGAWMFHNAEKMNRRVVSLAAYRLATKNGLDTAAAIEEAHLATESTQYEYARWNRPLITQGKKSIIFMFKMYLENTLYFVAREPGGKRTILLFLLISGIQGGPGAEDMMDIFDLVANLYNKHFGDKGSRSAIREDLRELAIGLNLDPNLVMNGLGSKYGLGPLHLLEHAGIPIPNVDISGSLSMGRIIPGLEPLTKLDSESGGLGESIGEASGAVLAVPAEIYKALSSDSPDTWKNLERGLPNAGKWASKAVRRATRGKETRMDGSTLTEYDLADPLDIAEIATTAMGFQSTEISQVRERDFALFEAAKFYSTRRSILLNHFAHATLAGDREGIADTRKAIENYNKSAPFAGLRISGKDSQRSLKRKNRERTMREQGMATSRRGQEQGQEIGELYPSFEEVVR